MEIEDKIQTFYLSGAVFITFTLLFSNAYAQYDFVDDLVDQASEGIKSTIGSIEVTGNNPIDTNQEEVDNLANSASEWFKSLFDFGKKTHTVTEDTLSIVAPSWVAPIIIIAIAGGVVLLIIWKGIRKVGFHMFIALAILAAVIVFLMLLDLLS